MRMNLRILIMGILMPAFNIVYANHVVNIECDIKIDIFNVHTTCEQGGVYEQVGILQRRSCEMNIGGSLFILDADERVYPYSMGVLIAWEIRNFGHLRENLPNFVPNPLLVSRFPVEVGFW